jgi:hypothetical protein
MTVRQLRGEMSAAEFTQWVGFYSYENKMRAEAERAAEREARR